ncbi:MAG: tRNA dihydrouridine synthase DusB, partial [Candidatus Omnitrophota bacterium]|nr:tRNA dihydrouridine synthase DusB [Candidatus Omnitrophota bacterium]
MRNDDPVDEMIKAKAILAPMSGVTDVPFRVMARKFGCSFAFTEMIDVNGIVYGNRKSLKLMEKGPDDSPLGVQIVGEDENKLVQVARICEEKGFQVVDINAGCPARKVIKGGKGAALLKDTVKLARIVRKLVRAVRISVTVKIRSGWDKNRLNCLEIARAVESEGARAICVHPRTKAQMYRGRVDHNITRLVKEAVKIPVFASGDIFSPEDAGEILSLTGADAVAVARGALGRPWIFRQINAYLKGKEAVSGPSFNELKNLIREHFLLCVEFYGDRRTFPRMYKHLAWYLAPFKNLGYIMNEYTGVRDA